MRAHPYACGSPLHQLSRRAFLGGLVGGSAILGGRALAGELPGLGKRLVVIWHFGGLSQLESWDPKSGTVHGGPLRSIQTSVPGIHVSEWLPHTARRMHHLLVVRSMSTDDDDHNSGGYLLSTGRREAAGLVYPSMGCVANRFLTPPAHAVPGFVAIGEDGSSPAFLGPAFGAVKVDVGRPPAHLERPASISADAARRRTELRSRLDQRFARQRSSAETIAYAHTFAQAEQLQRNRTLFDLSREEPRDHDRYGRHPFGQRLLQARRLLERGVVCVAVGHTGYDSHAENFNTHKDLLEDFDRSYAVFIDDLADRGLLSDTLVIAMGEFGRTPNINYRMGRDHWSKCWSLTLAGTGFPAGGVYGRTNPTGTDVAEKKVTAARFFHTVCRALGIDPNDNYQVDGQQVPVADPAASAVEDMLA